MILFLILAVVILYLTCGVLWVYIFKQAGEPIDTPMAHVFFTLMWLPLAVCGVMLWFFTGKFDV